MRIMSSRKSFLVMKTLYIKTPLPTIINEVNFSQNFLGHVLLITAKTSIGRTKQFSSAEKAPRKPSVASVTWLFFCFVLLFFAVSMLIYIHLLLCSD